MTRKQPIYIFALLASVTTILACATTPPRVTGTQLNPSDWRYNGPHPYQDDLTVQIALNDSVYLLEDIKDCQRYIDSMRAHWYAHPPRSELYGGYIIPLLSVEITNNSTADLSVPTYGTQIFASRDNADMYWQIGMAGSREPVKPIIALTDFFEPLLPDYAGLSEGASRLLADSVDVFGFYHLPTTQPGTYWITVTLQNYGWQESTPPIWTGRIQSDTLYFRIID